MMVQKEHGPEMKITKTWPLVLACLLSMATLSPPDSAAAFSARNLVYGSRGYDVNELQSRLKLLGYFHSKVDGIFGWSTYWAVRDFQRKFGKKTTGRVDMTTKITLVKATSRWHYKAKSATSVAGTKWSWKIWKPRPKPAKSAASSAMLASAPGLNSSDISLMAHAVYGEARGEPFVGQVAVAAVILNRLRDPKFPHSVPGIIYQPGAFTCVQDGQINLQPSQNAIKAVREAALGWDPSQGALYYFNPATATSSWIWSKPRITQIGSHIFSR